MTRLCEFLSRLFCGPSQNVAARLLKRLLRATADKDLDSVAALLSPKLRAIVPAISPSEFVTRGELIAWLQGLCNRMGTMRLDPWGLLRPTSSSAGAVVMFTCFDEPGEKDAADKDHGQPYWSTWKTIAAANTDEKGEQITQLFLVMDDPTQPDRETLAGVVTGWYDAYVNQDLEGFLAPLSAELEAINYNGYQTTAPVNRKQYHQGFLDWCQHNYPGGSIVNEVVVCGSWVATVVQFLTEEKSDGQQKMTNEIHFMQLDSDHKMLRQFFYETDRCGPTPITGKPCKW